MSFSIRLPVASAKMIVGSDRILKRFARSLFVSQSTLSGTNCSASLMTRPSVKVLASSALQAPHHSAWKSIIISLPVSLAILVASL